MYMPRHFIRAAIIIIVFRCAQSLSASQPPGIQLAANNRTLTFQGGLPEEVLIEIQLIDLRTGQTVHRRSPLYISSDYNGIIYPSKPRLDGKGFARLKLVISPPSNAELQRLKGLFVVWVLIDEGDADDTIEGKVIFSISGGDL